MISIVDYDAGNPTSVGRALAALGLAFSITQDPERVAASDRVIFPGVGHAASTMAVLRERGLDEALRQSFERGTPILGVCVGAQLSLSHSEEGDTDCLGLLPGQVKRFRIDSPLKVQHMGWNRVRVERPHPLLADLPVENEL
jgi:glutamine amidotransferase